MDDHQATGKLRGYILTYIGWLLGMLTAVPSALLVTYLLFRNFFPSWSELIAMENGILATLAAGVGAFITFFAVFQTVAMAASALYVRLMLKGYPLRRTATIGWLCLLIFLTPFVFLVDLTIGTIIILTSLWLLATPILARWLATRNHRPDQTVQEPAGPAPDAR